MARAATDAFDDAFAGCPDSPRCAFLADLVPFMVAEDGVTPISDVAVGLVVARDAFEQRPAEHARSPPGGRTRPPPRCSPRSTRCRSSRPRTTGCRTRSRRRGAGTPTCRGATARSDRTDRRSPAGTRRRARSVPAETRQRSPAPAARGAARRSRGTRRPRRAHARARGRDSRRSAGGGDSAVGCTWQKYAIDRGASSAGQCSAPSSSDIDA